jgi:hypothetical protein
MAELPPKSPSWRDHPFRLISSTGIAARPNIPPDHFCRKNAKIMAGTHNTMFRALNSVYYHAPLVQGSEKDTALLLRYCSIVYTFIHDHHSHEESHYFANIEKATGIPDLMSSSIEQHRELEAGLKALRDYANGTTPGAYDAAKLRGIIDDLAPALTTHLFDEVPAILDLHDKISSAELERIYGLMQKEAERTSNMTT